MWKQKAKLHKKFWELFTRGEGQFVNERKFVVLFVESTFWNRFCWTFSLQIHPFHTRYSFWIVYFVIVFSNTRGSCRLISISLISMIKLNRFVRNDASETIQSSIWIESENKLNLIRIRSFDREQKNREASVCAW